jgi:hypothetical protein
MHRKYRSLQRECRIQAALTGHDQTRRELEKMEQEYKSLADWLERQLAPAEEKTPEGGRLSLE